MADPISRYSAEFLGTFLLVFTVGCNVITGSPIWAATSIACVLMVAIYALFGISGANFNPAVSFTLALAGKMEWSEVFVYVIVQIVAGILGALGYGLLLGQVFNLAPPKGVLWYQAGLVELLYTFMLCFVVLNVATSSQHGSAIKNGHNQYYGLAIGFVIIAGGYAAGHISGACFNPAVAIGIDVSSLGQGFGWCAAYTAFELAGAGIAALLFRLIRADDYGEEFDCSGYPMLNRLLSEFIGTFMLTLTVGLNIIGKSAAPVWSAAAALMCMIMALSSCSGGHFNPAVTTAVVLAGRGKALWKDAAYYTAVQTVAGLWAAFTYTFIEGGENFQLKPNEKYGWLAVGIAEIIFTFLLCFVVLHVATIYPDEQPHQFVGLAIGFCLIAGGYAASGISGGVLNPAVAIGISSSHIINGGKGWPCLLYMCYEITGAALAAGVFVVTRPSEFRKMEDDSSEDPRDA
eukprot:gnl/TRDRNA2_/TRDRNA2_193163_c0_seq1.p1 gnl/TRDRNA2_/TRDRNA2_193163_c0~~gnl/TRDRNA2_/TRDRNA2_193163_c0_seq1.p1  ORF type:complete len:461 (+),score=65.56 gnl/TRDRNA2_/TRDRNA2_193163_c0_seq1:67-1449(+)